VLTGKPAHLETFDYLGLHRYFLTFCACQRTCALESAERCTLVVTQFRRTAIEERFALLAYCFMPDHVHLLVEARSDDSNGLRFIRSAKQYSGFHYRRAFGVRLWQRYGFERVLRNNEDSLRVARYILENPVRAGLVRKVEDYPFLGSDLYSIAQMLEASQFESRWYRSG
jgi:putative transposase